MALKREELIIIGLLVLIILMVKAIEFFKVDAVEGDARAFVLEELASNYPGADIGIMSITPMYNQYEDRYFEVKAKVTQDPASPCPQRSHIFFNYPVQNFVPQPEEVITNGCKVCTEGICVIAFEEEAIIASHTLEGTSAVQGYLNSYKNAVPETAESNDSWKVTWDDPLAHQYYIVDLHRNGTVLNVDQISKD